MRTREECGRTGSCVNPCLWFDFKPYKHENVEVTTTFTDAKLLASE